jgi:fructokinase
MRTHSNLTLVGIGEVLFDVFEDGTETLGGAPLNVAFHMHQLAAALRLGEGTIVSCVGADPSGEQILAALEQSGMSTRYIMTDPQRPTGYVSVFMHEGEPGYQIEADAAWDYLRPESSLDELAAGCDAVCFGSLAQRSPVSRATVRRFLERATQAVRLYDANLRRNTVSGEEGYSAEIVDSSCQIATVIKANCSELFTVSKLLGVARFEDRSETAIRRTMEMLLARYPAKAVILTRGAKGTLLLTRDQEICIGTSYIAPDKLHPVGAGDACAAGILFGLTLGWDHSHAMVLGNRMGAWVASQQPATPPLPDSILEFAREYAKLPAYVAEDMR